MLDFNSRTHVECDSRFFCVSPCLFQFQLTHSRGVRQIMFNVSDRTLAFQLTHSRGVRHHQCNGQLLFDEFQLTHSRGVRLHLAVNVGCILAISTHALTWSATGMHVRQLEQLPDFNSRTHVECDLHDLLHAYIQPISTHALTWSATGALK